MGKKNVKKEKKMHYEAPYVEVIEVEMEQMIAGSIRTKPKSISAEWGNEETINDPNGANYVVEL